MSLIGSNNEQKIWNYLYAKFGNAYGAAGMMGNLYAESALNPKNLQNSYEKKLGYTDDSYVTAVDNGTYTNFVKDSAGFGLAQWTYWSRKQNLLNYCKSKGTSIADLEMQLDFLYKELSESYGSVLSVLKSATTVSQASNAVLLQYERPADQSTSVQNKRTSYGQTYYNKYAKKAPVDGYLDVNGRYIRGYITPNYAKYAGTATVPSPTPETPSVTETNTSFPAVPFIVKVLISDLNYRSAGSMSGKVLGQTGKGSFTITEVNADGWGKLKSGAGWIYLKNASYCTIGKSVETTKPASFTAYKVKVTADVLNIRKGAGTNYGISGTIKDKGIYTIVAESNGTGATKWGKLKSGAGWISLDWCKKV